MRKHVMTTIRHVEDNDVKQINRLRNSGESFNGYSSICEDGGKQIFGNVSNCSIGSITLNIHVCSNACRFFTDERDERDEKDVNM